MGLSATLCHVGGGGELEARGAVPMPAVRLAVPGNHTMNYSSPTPISLTANTQRHTVEYEGSKTDAKTSADVKNTK